MSVLRSVVGLLGSGAILLAMAAGADGGTVTYKASKADFANPERGFYIADSYDPDHGWTICSTSTGSARHARRA